VLVEEVISVSMWGLPLEIAAGSGKFFEHKALACTVWLEINNNGSLQGGIGAGHPGTGKYDHEGSSVGRVS